MSGQRKPVLTGGCQCGAVRYALYAKPERAGICHCRMCQKAVGGPFFAWAAVRDTDFAWTRGTPARVPQFLGRGARLLRALRHTADVSLPEAAGPISVTLGSLDDRRAA